MNSKKVATRSIETRCTNTKEEHEGWVDRSWTTRNWFSPVTTNSSRIKGATNVLYCTKEVYYYQTFLVEVEKTSWKPQMSLTSALHSMYIVETDLAT